MKTGITALLVLIFVLTAAAQVLAIPPTGSQRPPEESKQQEPPQFLRPVEGETSITGTVKDQNQNAIKDVQVKLFVDGILVASAVSDNNGIYALKYPIDIGKDKTVMLWYVAPGTQWVPKSVVLHESRAAAAAGLISPCIPRVGVKPFLEFNVQMVDVATRNRQIAQSDCMKGNIVLE